MLHFLQTQNEDLRGECDKAKTTCKAQLKSVEQKAATDIDKLKVFFHCTNFLSRKYVKSPCA